MINNKILSLLFIAAYISPMANSTPNNIEQSEATVIFTSDLHGNFFPFDFIKMEDAPGSYARVATAVDSIRADIGAENVLLLDNGDILQGQPTVYFYNFIDIVSPHIAADVYNFMNVDAATIGNHDIEAGHEVYDRWRVQSNAPILAANVIDTATDKPYFQPYAMFTRGGIRIAVLGLLTPAIPAWLPKNLWSGMRFEDMEESAKKWIQIIREKGSPDVIIGLFHSGRDASKTTAGYVENASMTTALNVDGFDAVLMGHDHSKFCDIIINRFGKKVHLLNPANNALNIGVLTLSKCDAKTNITSKLIDISSIDPSERFLKQFAPQRASVEEFVKTKIAEITDSIFARDAFFGPSEFMTLIHELQLQISGADISMAAPLTFDGKIAKGEMTIADMFTLYKYENMLSTLRLTGREIKDYLEYSYSLWIQDATDNNYMHLIKYATKKPNHKNNQLKNLSYNFDSAAGINYTVDVTKPYGKRIAITTLSTGKPFDLDSMYTVAVNSYRAGGGGNHLTDGARISPCELESRVVTSTDKDLRYYLMKLLREREILKPHIDRNWEFVPKEIVIPAIATDREILFGKESSRSQK